MKQGRLHIRIDEDLAKSFRDFAKKNRTTVTALVQEFIVRTLESDKERAVEPAEQI